MFKVTIEKLTPKLGDDYRRYDSETVLIQTVEELDLLAVIKAVNKIKGE